MKESIDVALWNLAVSLPPYRDGEQGRQLGLLKPAAVPRAVVLVGSLSAARCKVLSPALRGRNAPRSRVGLSGALGRVELRGPRSVARSGARRRPIKWIP
jgi:hypothetical protein